MRYHDRVLAPTARASIMMMCNYVTMLLLQGTERFACHSGSGSKFEFLGQYKDETEVRNRNISVVT